MAKIQYERLVQKIAPEARLLRTWPLAGGISARMIAFEIEQADGKLQKMILRHRGVLTLQRNPHAVVEQFKLLQTLKDLGLSSPQPIYYDGSGEIFSTPFLVIEFIPGNMDLSPVDLSSAMCQFANQLAKIHRIDATNPYLSSLFQRPNRCAEMRTVPEKFNIMMEEGRIRTVLSSVGAVLEENTAVLLHGDYWPGNVLWQDGELVAVIDWEDATIGDPLIDLAISRLDLVWIFGIDAMHTFTHQYQSQLDINYTNLPYWDLCAALRLIRLIGSNLAAWVAFFPPYGRSDITEQSLLSNYHYFINQAFEKLVCASR